MEFLTRNLAALPGATRPQPHLLAARLVAGIFPCAGREDSAMPLRLVARTRLAYLYEPGCGTLLWSG